MLCTAEGWWYWYIISESSVILRHLRLWKLEAECILMSSWMDSGESFLRVVIVWKTRRTIFQTRVYRTWVKCSTKASESHTKNTGWGRQKRINGFYYYMSVCEKLMYWEMRSRPIFRAQQRSWPETEGARLCFCKNKELHPRKPLMPYIIGNL